ncbi:internal scaffolding protein [Dipodfec virus UA23Rod_1071]|uniref:Internal scaffolding protein n=1 Tax=Dipodfec virus UA23Rod_1071 TaxID=2929326 RepID=A0A976R862_9VIRU|nr:internal scaffolding protein [Dipodfec virus UA23Rod_1071]
MEIKTMEFKKFTRNIKERENMAFAESFDINYMQEKGGETFNLYESIQEAREDTELYPTLEKYGSIERMIINEADVYGDLRQVKSLKGELEKLEAAERLWNSLPWDVRSQFNNNRYNFMENGESWLMEKMAEKEEPVEITPMAQEKTNG